MTIVAPAALLISATWSLGAIALTAMPLYPWLTKFSRIWFCSSTLPLGGILMSTCTPASFSYLWTPAAAIFQNSLALLVTKASFKDELPESRLQPTISQPQTTNARDSLNIVFIALAPHFTSRRTCAPSPANTSPPAAKSPSENWDDSPNRDNAA